MWAGAMPAEGSIPHRADRDGLLVRLFPGDPAALGVIEKAARRPNDESIEDFAFDSDHPVKAIDQTGPAATPAE
jgi:hypothetical protein